MSPINSRSCWDELGQLCNAQGKAVNGIERVKPSLYLVSRVSRHCCDHLVSQHLLVWVGHGHLGIAGDAGEAVHPRSTIDCYRDSHKELWCCGDGAKEKALEEGTVLPSHTP